MPYSYLPLTLERNTTCSCVILGSPNQTIRAEPPGGYLAIQRGFEEAELPGLGKYGRREGDIADDVSESQPKASRKTSHNKHGAGKALEQ